MKFIRQFICLLVGIAAQGALADHHQGEIHKHHYDEEIVVSAPFNKKSAETALPIDALSGEALQQQTSSTLGDTLKNELGVHNSSFGPGVGLPVIRGQSGTRVQVMQNGVNTSDVSTLSPDHANGVEPILAERIEVIRGPSTLLYGNGAIGGIVNVIDSRVPESSFEETEFIFEQSHETATDENKSFFKLNTSIGGLNLHVDGFRRDSDDVEIDGFAIDELAIEEREELFGHDDGHDDEEEGHDDDEEGHDDDEDEGHDDEEEELVNSNGFVANTDAESEGGTVGFSFSDDRGFFGFSASFLDNEYGLPPGAHGHEEEGHDDDEEGHDDDEEGHDDDEEGHDDDEEGHDDEEEGQEFVRIDMEQVRYDFRAGLNFDDGFLSELRADISYTDYEHDEIEIEPSGEQVLGTQFENSGIESRFTLSHRETGGWQGVIGLQYTDTEFSAIGEEAFIPETDEQGIALFVVERRETDNMTWEVGARFENSDLDPAACDESETTASFSVSGIYDVNDESNVLVSLARSERAPSIEERYSNVDLSSCGSLDEDDAVLHAATGLFELGDPNLGTETSTNLEIGYRKFAGDWTTEINAYYNEIDDYIYLDLVEEDLANYVAEDARFYGLEGKVSIPFYEGDMGTTRFTLKGDYVRADFDDAGDVPRIPPARVGFSVAHYADRWSFDIGVTHVFEQDDTAEFELETEAYTDVSIYGDYHWLFDGGSELKLYIKGSNLLDEEIRNHTSFLKNFSPEPGLGVRIGLRFAY